MEQHNIGYLLHHITSVLSRNSDQVLMEQLGIGFSQFKILMLVQEYPGALQKTIASHLGLTEASVSRQVKLLVQDGFMTSQASQRSKREHAVYLSPKGVKVIARCLEILNNYHQPIFSRLTEKQQIQLAELLGVVHEVIATPRK